MLDKIFKAYDVRGVYPEPLGEDDAWRIGQGSAAFLVEQRSASTPAARTLVVGRDMRASSPSLAKELIRGMTERGASVVDIGLIDTPMLYFAVNHLHAAGGVMTTASHNPPQYNGFKVCAEQAKPVGESTGLKDIKQAAAAAQPGNPAGPPGRVAQQDLWAAYAKHVLRFANLGGRRLRVVIDASNGMAGTMIPLVFGPRGSNVPGLTIVEMNFENDKGVFAHEPNPLLPSAIAGLQQAVVREGADLGLCFDGDADRCIAVDEKGAAVGCDHLTAWLGAWFLRSNPGAAVVYDLRSSKAVEEDVRAAGGKPVRGRVGHVFLKALLAEHRAVFGGELSGHFYFRDNFNADSGAIAMASVLTCLAQAGKPMSECIRGVARYPQSGEINFKIEDKDGALAALKSRYSGRGKIDELDGVTVDCFDAEGWWCSVRKSNTEPLLRLNLEARDEATLRRMIGEIAPTLGERDAGH